MDFNPDQFRQGAFRGFGDQAMRRYRVTPDTPTAPQPAPQRSSAATGHQGSLFQAAEVNGPPPLPTFNSDQFRRAQHALPGMSNPAMASQRVTPPAPQAEPSAAPQSAASGPGWTQPQIPYLGPTASSVNSPSAAGPTPTHWPSPAPPTAPAAASAPRPVRTVNANQVRNLGPSRISAAQSSPAPSAPAPSAVPPRPTSPPRQSAAPGGPRGLSAPPGLAKAGRYAAVGAFVAAKALQSISKPATDPKRSGNPLYKSSTGWMRS